MSMPALLLLTASLAAEPLLLDAGTLAAPVQDGFEALHPGGSTDVRATWVEPPRHADVLLGPDPPRTDQISGGTLHLDLAEGTWDLWLLVGTSREDPRVWASSNPVRVRVDGTEQLTLHRNQPWAEWLNSGWYAANPRPTFEPGQTAWHRQVAVGRPWRRVRVDVDDDGIDLQVQGLALHAITAWPAEQAIEAEVEHAVIDAFSAAWYARHRAPEVASPEASEAPLGASWVSGTYETSPTPWAPHMAQGDRVHRLLRLAGGDGAGTVRVETPPGLVATVREATWLDARGHRDRALKPRPWVLDGEGAWGGGQGVPPTLSVTLTTTDDAVPGAHTVTLVLERDGDRHDVAIPVTVHGLPLVDGPPSGLFLQVRQEATVRTGMASRTVHDLVTRALTQLSEHGLDAVGVRYTTWPEDRAGADVDLTVYRHLASTWAELGGRALLWSDPKLYWRSLAYRRTEGRMLRSGDTELVTELLEVAAETGAVVHTYEEEAWQGLHAVDRAPGLFTLLRELLPDGPPLAATAPTAADHLVAASADVVLVTGRDPAAAAAAVRDDATVWAYNLAPGRDGPLQAWSAGAETFLQWHADPRSVDTFDDSVLPGRWTHQLLHPDGTFHPTVLLADLAAGVADVRVLATLEACARPGSRDHRLVQTWRETLATARPTPASEGALWSDAQLDALRRDALTRLDTLAGPRCLAP